MERSVLIVAVVGSVARVLSCCLRRRTPTCDSVSQGKQQQQAHSNSTHEPIVVPANTYATRSNEAAAQAVVQLQEVYAGMAAAFSAQGLDLAAVGETAAWFETGPPAPWPRRYSSFTPHPLLAGSVRLVVVPLADNCPRLASTAAAVAADMLRLLPPGCKVFSNARQNLHITVFHFSHPLDTRPDAMDPCSGLAQCLAGTEQQGATALQQQQQEMMQLQQTGQATDAAQQQQQQGSASGVTSSLQQLQQTGQATDAAQQQQQHGPASGASPFGQAAVQAGPLDTLLLPAPHARPGPTAQQLAAEQAAAASIAAATPPFTLQFERVLLARSGVLLLAWSDPSGALAALRRSLQGRFPGACSKQSSIIHTSLFRIVEAPAAVAERQQQQQHDSQEGGGSSSSACCPLSEAAVAAVSAACERWTDKLRGLQLAVSSLWWVCEEEFSSIQGQRVLLPCGALALQL